MTKIDRSTPAKTGRLLRSAQLNRGRRIQGRLQSGTTVYMRLNRKTLSLALLRSDNWPPADEWQTVVDNLLVSSDTQFEKRHNSKGYFIFAKSITLNKS